MSQFQERLRVRGYGKTNRCLGVGIHLIQNMMLKGCRLTDVVPESFSARMAASSPALACTVMARFQEFQRPRK